jgi:hypothetical protein
MKKLALTLALVASLATTGCANMTPEDNARVGAAIGGALLGGLAVAAAVADARHPVYTPVYVAPVYVRCSRWGC